MEAGINIGSFTEGEMVPLGKLETYYIINLRNMVLRDNGINLPVPVATSNESEFDCFKRLLAAANSTPGNGYRYYYPAASAAYAYEPSVKVGEMLSPKLKTHQWFLPTPGDLQRIRCLISSNDAFAKSKAYISNSFSSYATSTGETSDLAGCYKMLFSNGSALGFGNGDYLKSKSNSAVYPMVQF